jgi:tetratricopeptide (TPR) repeat protein
LSKLKQIRGDTFYRGKEYDKAILEYQECFSAIQDDPGAFDYAWANYRLGLCFEDDNLAIQHLSVASLCFERLNFLGMQAKSDGERAIALYRKGNVPEAVKILYGIVERYYLGGVKEYSPAATVGLASLTAIEAKLKGEPFVEGLRSGAWHPEFKKRLFEEISEEAAPRAGICAAYFMFAEVFELLGDRNQEITALYRAFEGTAGNVMETETKAWAGLKLVGLLVEKGEEAEVYDVLCKIFETDIKGGVFSEPFWKYYIFTKTEESLKQGKILHKKFAALLNGVREAVQRLPSQRKSWWLAEGKMRQAGIDGVTSENDYRQELLREALGVAREARNYEVLVQVGHQIGFVHYHGLDFKEIAEAQLAVITGVCNDGGEISRLQIVGQNMFNFWVGISYNRLKESDLPYWLNLARRAKRMHKDSPADVGAVLMISSLLIVTGAIVNDDCQKAVAWVKRQLSGKMEQISEDDRGYLRELLAMV